MEYLTTGKLSEGEKKAKAIKTNGEFLHYSSRQALSPKIFSAAVKVLKWRMRPSSNRGNA